VFSQLPVLATFLVMPFEMASSDSRIIFFLQQLQSIHRLGKVFVDEAHFLIEDSH
jgi:hypothetical protein